MARHRENDAAPALPSAEEIEAAATFDELVAFLAACRQWEHAHERPGDCGAASKATEPRRGAVERRVFAMADVDPVLARRLGRERDRYPGRDAPIEALALHEVAVHYGWRKACPQYWPTEA